MPSSSPFTGSLRRLVLAFDVGTTFSGISFAVLDPGGEPKIQTVTRYACAHTVLLRVEIEESCATRFPGQASGDFKIPSLVWYSQDGLVRACGAEARDTQMRLEAEDDNLVLAEWHVF